MEKIKLNNQIVFMRKYVKQAKVHIINKLVKQVKFLQNRKGNEIQVKKAERKAKRYLETVALLKKIKPDDISKLALSKAKDWKDVLQQKNSTLQDRCIAMLANYGAVQKEVGAFYNANKELVLKISDYFAQWEEKNKLSKDSPKTNKKFTENKSSKNIQKVTMTNEILLNSKKNKFKLIGQTKNDSIVEKDDTAFKKDLEDFPHLEAEDYDSIDDNGDGEKVAVKQNSNNHKNPFKNITKIKKLHSSQNNLMEVAELNNNNEENESDKTDEDEELDKNDEEKESDKNDEDEELDNNDEESESDKNDEDEELDNNDEESESDKNDEDEEMRDNSLNDNNKKATDTSNEENINEVCQSVSKSDLLPKMFNNAKNKLKEITLLNLNELEGLDEIPVSSSFENEGDEKESSEDEIKETSENKTTDPFFLGNNKEDSMQSNSIDPFFLGCNNGDTNAKESDMSPKDNSNYSMNKDSVHSFRNRTQNVKNSSFHRRDNWFNSKDSFQRSSYNHRNVSKQFKKEENSKHPFKTNKFASKNHHNKFQEKRTSKNKKDFNLKSTPFSPENIYDKKQFKNISKAYESKDNIPLKNKMVYKKDNASLSLHPSWEAKRKQKELLSTSFQGKRMVFND